MYTKRKVVFILAALVLALVAVTPVMAAPAESSLPSWHQVSWGETVYSIGRYYNVSPAAIAAANELYNANHIYAGQWLYIPAGPPYYQPHCNVYYTVQRGDTLFKISRMYNVSAWRIASANEIYNMNHIWVGQRLYIPCS